MTAYKKMAVTVPADTYQALERARDKLGKSRSEAVATAIKEWLRGLDVGAARKRYVAGYLRHPESTSAVDATVQIATADWSSWEPGPPSRAAAPRRRKKP